MIIFFTIFFLFLLIAFIYYALKTYKLVFELTHPQKHKSNLNLKIPFTYKKFEFTTKDGVKLIGIDYQPKTVCRGTILVCHFLGGSKEDILMFVDFLIMHGYRVISFDNCNHGESETVNKIKFSLEEDFTAFYEKIKSMNIKGPFGIMGFSMGASLALWALDKYDDIEVAVTDSGPLLYVKTYFNYVLDNKKIKNPVCRAMFLFVFLYYIGFSKMAKKTIKLLQRLNGRKKVFLIHGERDNIISVDNAKYAYELLKSNKASVWYVPQSRHLTNKHIKPKEYEERIAEFFDKNLTDKSNDEKNSSYLSKR